MHRVPARNPGQAAGLFDLRSPFLAVALAGALVACSKSSSSPNAPPAVTLQALTIDPPTATIGKGLAVHFAATGHYSDDSTAIMPFVTWSTSDIDVADIDAAEGLASCKKPGPVTVTATDSESGISGTAQLTVEDATLQNVEIVPSVATVVIGFSKKFELIGHYSDGSSTQLSNVTWSASDNGASVGVTALGVVTGHAAGTLTLTGKEAKSGLSATAALTVAPPPTPVDVAASSSRSLDSTGLFFGHVAGLAAGTEYLVRVSSADPAVTVEADRDGSFASYLCSTWAAGPACHAGALAGTEVFYMVSGAAGTAYTVDVFPIPGVLPSAAVTVTTEDYYKIAVAPGVSTFTITLAGLSDHAADVFVYDSAQPAGNFDSNLLCSTATSLPLDTKTCTGAVPASGALYITVEGWLTGSAAPVAVPPGSTYTLSL